MNAGLPANLVKPPSSQGAGKPADWAFGSWFQMPVKEVARPSGMDAAWSNEILSGILVDVSHIRHLDTAIYAYRPKEYIPGL